MTEEYRIERIRKETLKDMLPLFLDAFSKKVSLDYLIKKFDTDYTGASYIGFIAYDAKGNPAGYYGLFPYTLIYKGQKALAAISGDSMTHSAHQKKGLFTVLAKKTYELAKQSGIKIAFGFPNQNILKGTINTGWQYHKDDIMNFYSIPVNTLPFAKVIQKLNLSDLVFSSAPKKQMMFPNSLAAEDNGYVLHDQNYYNYKTYYGNKIITIAGCKVWVRVDGIMRVGDVERVENFNTKQFLKSLKSYASLRGIKEIQFFICNDTWLDKALSRELSGKPVFQVAHFDLNAGDIDFRKFKYGMSDIDTF